MPTSFTSRFFKGLTGLGRNRKQLLMMLVDTVLLAFSVWGAYSLRFGVLFVPSLEQLLLMMAAPALSIPFFIPFGLYRSVVRYMGEHALWAIIKSVGFSAIIWSTLAFMTSMTGGEGVPRSVPVIYALLAVMMIGASRFGARWVLWLPVRRQFSGRQVLIYGTGSSGRQLAAALQGGQELFPAGFIDDDPELLGKDLDGLRVYSISQIGGVIEKFDIHDVIVTLSSDSNLKRQAVVKLLEEYPVKVRILPAVAEIANGKHLVNMVREVDIGDLLGRDPVAADPKLIGKDITGKVVMVTGAGGSIGSELCRQVVARAPSRLILLEASEHALYQIDRSLGGFAACEVVPCLGSVGDRSLVVRLLERYGVQTIYHAAAHKHVPLVECNIAEGVSNNVFGSRTLAAAALEHGVETFVLISTDKAVRPTNAMGATKRWAEIVMQECDRQAQAEGRRQRFCAVRFGNVLGSSGSVIPLFKEQIGKGGPVTVTHEEVTRYFMSIHEAVELVIQAGSMAAGGEIFLLDMGEPVKIIDLARNMVRLAGHEVRDAVNPDGDIDIVVTGLRPGEKLYEELLIADENAQPTAHPKIMKAVEPGLEAPELDALLKRAGKLIADGDEEPLRKLLLEVAS
ncbi:MAG: polysaccharide biosynthesis protein [Chlorobiaceae bacterium]|nr:polysaccharide biosynthesis protein [Chlorobiaceae bacterium]